MSTDTTTDEATETEDAPEPDPVREEIVAVLRDALGDGFCDSFIRPGREVWVRVTPAAWETAWTIARDRLGLRHFGFLSAIDWMPSPYGKGEDDPTEPPPEPKTEIEQGIAGGETRFQVFGRAQRVTDAVGLILKADVPESMTMATIIGVYAGADWHERETHEMFGIGFDGHPNLINIYLPGDFEGHPLRKDFPLAARMVKPWPGIVDVEPMPTADDEESDEGGDDAAAEGGE